MTGFGVLLIILGLGSLLLPMLNLQFRLMELVDPYQPWAGIVVAAIGAVLLYLGLQRTRTVTTTTSTTTPPSVPAGEGSAAPPATPPSGEPPADAN